MRLLLPADGAARFLAVFESVIEREIPWSAEDPEGKSAEAM